MLWTVGRLDHFVEMSDSLGGPHTPACQEFWADFAYQPSHTADQRLDPFSEDYVAEQVKLYEELAGHSYDIQRDERTAFDVELHITASNPYNHPDPGVLALHLQRLSRALRYARPRRGESLLDMGCGWGLSSELAAYLGLSVTAVDINPSFVRLVNERAKRGSRSISATTSTFEEFKPGEPTDIILFYECLHHAVRPWLVVEQMTAVLRNGGRVVLAGEPINDYWWKNWGMRLDPISVYCIRKFGWFESGWSLGFIRQVLHRSGLVPQIFLDADPEIGFTIVGEKPAVHRVPGNLCAELFGAQGCFRDGNSLIFVGLGKMTLSFPHGTTAAELSIINYRGRSLRVFAASDGQTLYDGHMLPGHFSLKVPRIRDAAELAFQVERWVPDEELHNGDNRTLGLHLQDIAFSRE